ncbi:Techylectin-5A [Araneus ventricosus]|uniref:Techylectin-5A n=1 Tax=Araneus ventricosus TaxID=182803 RepID=A0A4Y2BIZ9_ARAVE|nr:Techylectin-5A [Araneus ventricosus]
MDCAELLENGVTESGVHAVYPRSRLSTCKSIDVYCDMETDGGGWTVIQRRGQYGNGEDYFVKKWKAYKEGFGNMKKEFWLGNDQVHSLTNQGHYSVRMDMTDDSGKKVFTHFENFWIENEEAKYKLHLTDGSGPGGTEKYVMSSKRNHKCYISPCLRIRVSEYLAKRTLVLQLVTKWPSLTHVPAPYEGGFGEHNSTTIFLPPGEARTHLLIRLTLIHILLLPPEVSCKRKRKVN